MNTESIQLFLSTTAIDVGIKILAALAFWFIGRWLIGRVIALIRVALGRSNVDPTPTKYLGLDRRHCAQHRAGARDPGYFGIETTSFAAMLAGAGLAHRRRMERDAQAISLPGRSCWCSVLSRLATFVSIGGIWHGSRTRTLRHDDCHPDNVMTLVGNGKVFGDTIQNFSALAGRRTRCRAWRGLRRLAAPQSDVGHDGFLADVVQEVVEVPVVEL